MTDLSKKLNVLMSKETQIESVLSDIKYERKELQLLCAFEKWNNQYKEYFEGIIKGLEGGLEILNYCDETTECDYYMTASDNNLCVKMRGIEIEYQNSRSESGKHSDMRIEKITIDNGIFYCYDTYNVGRDGSNNNVEFDMEVIKDLKKSWEIEGVSNESVLEFLNIFMNSDELGGYCCTN